MLRIGWRPNRTGALSIADGIVAVIFADAAERAMIGESKSITASIVLIGTIVSWDFLFAWLGFRSPRFQKTFVTGDSSR